MKNQYFGDINDYRKYGLLRVLQTGHTRKLLVAWMLTPDDDGGDGQVRAYLQQPERWGRFDPELYDSLTALLQSASSPRVSLIEGTCLLPRATFCSAEVPNDRRGRDVWREGLRRSISELKPNLVFFDPDNGIEVPSAPVGRKGSSKYVTWQEIQETWAAGCSLLIYQHFRREPRETFAARMVSELHRCCQHPLTLAFRTAHVLFLLVVQPRHETWLQQAVASGLPRWKGQIEMMGAGYHVDAADGVPSPQLNRVGR